MGAAQICHAVGRVMLVVIFMWSAINNWRNSATATAKMAQNGFPEGSAGIALTMATVVAMIGSLLGGEALPPPRGRSHATPACRAGLIARAAPQCC